jgi:cellulase (glycosyl hydrolase family 5)
MKRRRFLKTVGGAVYTGSALTLSSTSHAQVKEASPEPQTTSRIRVAIFDEPSFPIIDGLDVVGLNWRETLKPLEVNFLSAAELLTRLNQERIDLFINPYGSAFPQQAWRAIEAYLRAGGNWLNLGGVPFSAPVARTSEGWRAGARLTNYHKKLGITQSFSVSGSDVVSYQSATESAAQLDLAQSSDGLRANEIFELYVRFSSTSEFPEEGGSYGPREAALTPLVFGLDAQRRKIAAPVIQIDRLQGDFAGGRWVLANFKGTLASELLRTLVALAAEGAHEFTARAIYARYREGETPGISVELRRPARSRATPIDQARVEVRDQNDKLLAQLRIPLTGQGEIVKGEQALQPAKPFVAGFYRIEARLDTVSVFGKPQELKYTSAFWVSHDSSLNELAGGKPFTADKHFLYRDGAPYPVTGTTYMASDVHRKFLFEPNPYIWDQDFRAMKEAGVNMVRTGLWTAWKKLMADDRTEGMVSEAALRALDAFLITARKYDIPIIFTFFAFLPETWGGTNAYLDPRSQKAQQKFIEAFAQRYRASNDLIWDLINEPSFCNPKYLWSCRPNYDEFEESAWRQWLKERYKATTDDDRREMMRELWGTAADDPLTLPRLQDFDNVNIFEARQPLKTVDYKVFAQEMFNRWTRLMVATIRRNGNERQMITVGQDEAGTGDSPAPQFFAPEVDFTCLHNWWANDDLLWDGVVTKAPSKPNLVEETGVMFYEKMDGSAWRTETSARDLLERKMALSLGANGAGFIQWIWNTNCYMASDNEVAIGFHRVDQTAKPELQPLISIAKFASAHKSRFRGKQDEDVLLVVPHSQLFSTRNLATEATRRSVRAMHYYCQVPMRAVSEYTFHELTETPKLIVVPSPRVLRQQCWEALLGKVQQGSTLVITGIIDADEHWRPVSRGQVLECESAPVAGSEFIRIGEIEHHVRYAGEKIQRVEKAQVSGEVTANTKIKPMGRGRIIWSPLPLELGETLEPVIALYQLALAQAGLRPAFTLERPAAQSGSSVSAQVLMPEVLIRPTVFADAVLYSFVSETDRDTEIRLQHTLAQTGVPVNFSLIVPGRRTALVMLDSSTGKVIGSTAV